MPAARATRPQIDGGPLLDQLEQLRGVVVEARQEAAAAQAKYDSSGRWFDQAETDLRRALEAGAAPDALAELRDRVTDLGATRIIRERIGSSTRYADTRARAALEDAQQAEQDAAGAVHRFVHEHEEGLQRALLTRSEAVADELLAAYGAASTAAAAWRRHRDNWLALMPVWGLSPSELPPLLGSDADQALQDALLHQERAGGHVRHPRLLCPAPVSVQLRDPADARIPLPGHTVPDEQRRWPREDAPR